MMTRREFATGAGITAALAKAVGTAAAAFAEQPDGVTIEGLEDARADIERYQPLLDLSDISIRPNGLYAWKATSESYDHDWYEYWHYYSAQQGATIEDSHLPDREPIYIGVSDGAVETVVHSAWHYSVEQTDDPPLYEDTHPKLHVISPWHGTVPTEDSGEFITLSDFKSVYPDWLANGWSVHRGSVVDPPTVIERGNWWREDDQFNHRMAVLFYNLTGFTDWNPFRLDEGW